MPFDLFPMVGQLQGLILPGMTPAEIRALWSSEPEHPSTKQETFIRIDKDYKTPAELLSSSDETVCSYYRDNIFVFPVYSPFEPFALVDNFFASLPHRHMSLIQHIRLDRGPLGTDSAVRRRQMCQDAIRYIQAFSRVSKRFHEKGELDVEAWTTNIATRVKTNVIQLCPDGSTEVFWWSWAQLDYVLKEMNRPVEPRASLEPRAPSRTGWMKQ